MWNKNYDFVVTFVACIIFAIALIIAGMMMGAMSAFTNFKENACYNSYDDKEDYASCEALRIEDFTKRITVKE